jgi:hypothetical protein
VWVNLRGNVGGHLCSASAKDQHALRRKSKEDRDETWKFGGHAPTYTSCFVTKTPDGPSAQTFGWQDYPDSASKVILPLWRNICGVNSGHDLISHTNRRSNTHIGNPKWNRLFRYQRKFHIIPLSFRISHGATLPRTHQIPSRRARIRAGQFHDGYDGWTKLCHAVPFLTKTWCLPIRLALPFVSRTVACWSRDELQYPDRCASHFIHHVQNRASIAIDP